MSVRVAMAVAASGGNRTVPCSSAREGGSWMADPTMVVSKVAGEGMAGGSTPGNRLFRWPSNSSNDREVEPARWLA